PSSDHRRRGSPLRASAARLPGESGQKNRNRSALPSSGLASSLAHPPGCDLPHGFHSVPAQAKDAVVEVHRRVAVRDLELHPIPQVDRGTSLCQVQTAVLIATPGIRNAWQVPCCWHEGTVGGKGFEAAIDDGQGAGGLADHGRQYREGFPEILKDR